MHTPVLEIVVRQRAPLINCSCSQGAVWKNDKPDHKTLVISGANLLSNLLRHPVMPRAKRHELGDVPYVSRHNQSFTLQNDRGKEELWNSRN